MNKKKFCSFYISEYHLLTILLPYINEQILNSQNVKIILEDDMIEYVKKYLRKNDKYNVNKIIKLGWKKTKNENLVNAEKADVVVIIGKECFVQKINERIYKNEQIKEVINCYNVETINSIAKIVEKHDLVLRTTGFSEIDKSSHNEQKRKTIQTQI